MSDPFRLDGKRALVTGANTGIGQAIAVSLAQAGAHVIAAGRSSCAETVDLMKGGEALTLDLADPAAGAEVLAGVADLDILVNNAGIIRRADSVDYTQADWDDVMDVNLKAVFLLCQTFAKSAIARGAGGRIVNVYRDEQHHSTPRRPAAQCRDPFTDPCRTLG